MMKKKPTFIAALVLVVLTSAAFVLFTLTREESPAPIRHREVVLQSAFLVSPDQPKVDLGDLGDSTRYIVPIVFCNTTSEPLTFRRAESSCSCVMPKNCLPLTIAPGAETTLPLTVKAFGYLGHKAESVTLFDGTDPNGYFEVVMNIRSLLDIPVETYHIARRSESRDTTIPLYASFQSVQDLTAKLPPEREKDFELVLTGDILEGTTQTLCLRRKAEELMPGDFSVALSLGECSIGSLSVMVDE